MSILLPTVHNGIKSTSTRLKGGELIITSLRFDVVLRGFET